MEYREVWHWEGPGWYGPRAEGQGWSEIHMHHIPWAYGAEQHPDTDDDPCGSIWDVARFYNVGTPAYYKELPED